MAKPYRTAITTHLNGKPYVYGYDLTKLAGSASFARAIYLVLKGEMPDKASEKMFEAMLTIAIDHGVEPASVVAAGILAFGEYHGGAIEAAMENFKKYCPPTGGGAKKLIEDFTKAGQRIPGFGHRVYAVDPRTQRLLELTRDLGFYGKYVKLALAVENGLSTGSKKLPLNIDGIFAALLLEMGFNPKVGKGVFIIARIPGLVAHVVEEALREKPVRRLTEKDIEYDGPRPRK